MKQGIRFSTPALCRGLLAVSIWGATGAVFTPAFSQINEKQILDLIAQNDLARAQKMVEEVWRRHPDSPAAHYYRALLIADAQKAFEAYQLVSDRFPDTVWGRKSAFRLAQFYFARGFYFTARKYFLDIARRDSGPLGQRARYYAAKSLFAAGKRDSARTELRTLQRQTESQLLQALIEEDLHWYDENRNLPGPVPLRPLARQQQLFVLQIGSYRQKENAESQMKYFGLLGYPVQVESVQKKGKTYYRVLLGKFATRATAKRFGEAFKKRYGLSFRILPLGEGHD